MSFPSVHRWFGLYSERVLDPVDDGYQSEMCIKLLQLALHHPQAAAYSYKALAGCALAVVVGVPLVERATPIVVDGRQLEWIMQFLNAPSMTTLSVAYKVGRGKRRRMVEAQLRKGQTDLDFMLAAILA